MITVKGTREGLIGGHTASGYIINTIVTFCALPTPHALGRHVRITNPANGRMTNGAGIDLGENVWKLLGMTDNSNVSWEFID